MDNKDKQFCKHFLETFDFNLSCTESKTNKNRMYKIIQDTKSEVSVYLKSQVQLYTLQNTYLTKDLIKFKLGEIINKGENQHIIQAAKLLMEYEDTVDKTKEFKDLIQAIKGT